LLISGEPARRELLGREIVEAGVRAHRVVQRDAGTPTGLRNVKSCIVGIRGLDASFIFVR
jgi:hypothetical protein